MICSDFLGRDGIRTHLHHNRPLHQGDPSIPPGCITEGGEGGGVSRSVSGSKMCRPRPVSSSCTSGRGTRGRELRTSTSYPEKPVVQPLGFRTRWRSPLEPYPFGGPGKHSRHFQIRLRHCYRRSSSAAESSTPEAPGHPPMQRSTSGRREERQGYCWYAPCRVPSTFHWQLNWLWSAKGVMVP